MYSPIDIRRAYSRAYTNNASTKGEGKKENRKNPSEGKRKQTESNVQRVYGICVGNPLGNDLPQSLVHPPSLADSLKHGVLKLRMVSCHVVTYVPVNSKTAHPPPRAIPGHLTRVKLRTVGNLT